MRPSRLRSGAKQTEVRLQSLAQAVQEAGGFAYIRRSQRNVPHLVIEWGTLKFSAVWFHKSQTYRLFWPWPSDKGQQKRQDCASIREVVEFLEKGSSHAP